MKKHTKPDLWTQYEAEKKALPPDLSGAERDKAIRRIAQKLKI